MNGTNGFNLILIITIVVMGFRIYNLNRECESYVAEILKISWAGRSQEKDESLYNPNCKDCYGWEEYCGYDTHFVDPPQDPYANLCAYCLEIERRITGDECVCEVPF